MNNRQMRSPLLEIARGRVFEWESKEKEQGRNRVTLRQRRMSQQTMDVAKTLAQVMMISMSPEASPTLFDLLADLLSDLP